LEEFWINYQAMIDGRLARDLMDRDQVRPPALPAFFCFLPEGHPDEPI
jgi:hypothetical protein